ncbi:MAG: PAS domain S-box protein, partial [Candidatus Thorarchaeota archaeon]
MNLESLLERRDISSEVKEAIIKELFEFKNKKTRLEYLLKSGPAIIYACEPWGEFQTKFMSENVEDILGHDPNDFLYNPSFWEDGIHPKDKQRVTESFSQILHTNFFSETYRFQQKNGTYRWMLEEANLIRDEKGEPLEIIGYWTDITKQKKAEKQLRNERENLYRILNSTDDLIYIVNSNYEIEFINAAAEKEFGPMGRKKCYQYFNDFTEPCSWCIMEKVLNGEIIRREKTLSRNQKTYDMIDTPLRNVDGSISSLAIFRDTTERKQIEEALRESEKKYRLLFELAPIGIGIANLEGRVLEANRKILETTGYTSNEIKTVSLSDTYVKSDDRKEVLKQLQDNGQIRDFELELRRKDGTPYYSQLNSKIMELGDQKVILTTQRDLTEWKEMDRAKRESEERLRKFMESATDGFLLMDSDLNFIDINTAGLTGLGLHEDEIIGKNFLEIFPKLQNSKTYSKYLEVLTTGNPYYIDDIGSIPRVRGKYYSVRAFKVGEGLGIITTDITDRVKAEKTREELEQRRDNFVWMTSHELRTPLTVLTGYCEFLIENINEIPQKRITNILKVMKTNLDRFERLTSKVSTVGQIERGIFEIEKTSMNLCTYLKDILEPYHQLLGNQFEFQGCLEDSSVIIEGDPQRLQQVFDNIIGNAIKQTNKNTRKISVISKIFPSEIQIEVSDNGAGIEPKNLELIFDQFVSIPTEFSATGTGIGLYLCRETLEALGGGIIAQSDGSGLGTTFIIKLPRKNALE